MKVLSADQIQGDFVRLISNWARFTQETELWNDIGEVGVRAAEISEMIHDLRTRNGELRSRIRSALH